MKKSFMMMTLALGMLVLVLSLTVLPLGAQQEVKVGALQDQTGPTSDVGKDEALGVYEAVQYYNEHGGINGKKINLLQRDYGYKIPEAITLYKSFQSEKVVMVLGWGTGDTEALKEQVNADKTPFISSSFSAHLTDPKKTPYNFVYAADYSTNARAAITYWFEEIWKKDPKFKAERDKKVKPRFMCFYQWDSPYCSAPIKAIKDQATLLGFEVGPDQNVSLKALDAKSNVLKAKEFKAHLLWHGNTTNSVSTAVKDAYSLKLGADHIVNNWGFDENLPKLAGEAAEGVIGLGACAFIGDEFPMKKFILEYAKKFNAGTPLDKRLIRTVQGWVKVSMAVEAMKRADKAGKLNGPGIKEAFETFKNFDLTPYGGQKATITSKDHRLTSIVKVARIIKGKPVTVKDIDMKAKFPKLWDSWLGW
jgi:branched-chain amino acid transport system substrate-binding protein